MKEYSHTLTSFAIFYEQYEINHQLKEKKRKQIFVPYAP